MIKDIILKEIARRTKKEFEKFALEMLDGKDTTESCRELMIAIKKQQIEIIHEIYENSIDSSSGGINYTWPPTTNRTTD